MKRKFWSGFTSVMLAVAFLLQAGNIAWKLYQDKQPKAAIAPAKQYARVQMNWDAVKLESNVWKIHREGQPDSYLLGTYHKSHLPNPPPRGREQIAEAAPFAAQTQKAACTF